MMSYTSENIKKFCDEKNIACSEEQALNFDKLYNMLIEFNSHTNITALKTEEDICARHFIDSLYPLAFGLIPNEAKVIDIGCGGGFPGLPLKMMRDDIDISFVDSTEKKLRFTKSVSDEFSLDAKIYPARAEELIKDHRENSDVVVSRAVADLPVLCELCIPYVKTGGMFIAYKSFKETDKTNKDTELSRAMNAIKKLGGNVEKIYKADITEASGEISEHALIVIKKTAKTALSYPRRYAAILKKPL